MITLSNGYQKPQDGVDAGSAWFPAMENNIQKLNDHTHNFTGGSPDSSQLYVKTQAILAANWAVASVGGGLYQQTMTMPSGYLYDVTDIFFRLSTGEIWVPTVVRLSASTYQLFINDSSLASTAFYR